MPTDRARRSPAPFGPVLAAVALSLILAPTAEAQTQVASGALVVTRAIVASPLSQEGDLEMLHTARQEGDGTPSVVARGATLRWLQTETQGPAAQVAGGVYATGGLVDSLDPRPPPGPATSHHAQFQAHSAQPAYMLHIYAASPVEYSAEADSATLTQAERAHLGIDGIRQAEAGDAEHPEAPRGDFHQFTLGHPSLITAPGGATEITLRGSFVVEMRGISGTIRGSSGSHNVESGSFADPVAPGVPSDTVYNERIVFLRLWVEGGSATIILPDGSGTQWAGDEATTTVRGAMTFESATGSVLLLDGTQGAVDSSRYTLDGHHAAAAQPGREGMSMQVTGLDAEGRPLGPTVSTARAIPGGLLLAMGGAAIVVAGIAVGAWSLRRHLRTEPTMADVEASLASGHYGRAARDAARILRRKPGMETAVISRAIALAKAGRNERVVAEVEQHLRQTDPSDGVLHYVLGVAYSDLGQPQQAEAAFQEALTRTPDLLPEVRSRLPTGSRPPAPSSKPPAESHGYA